MSHSIPATVSTSATAAAVSITGGFSNLFMQSLTADQPIYVRSDGTTAVVEADLNYAVPPSPGYAIIPTVNGGTTTDFSAISSANAKLYIREMSDCDD
jgi:hypothetical protein